MSKSVFLITDSLWFFLSAVWGGAKLADVLELIGIPKLTRVTKSGGKHVEFVSIDKCKVMNMACMFYLKILNSFILPY
jgi:hypothetical protein